MRKIKLTALILSLTLINKAQTLQESAIENQNKQTAEKPKETNAIDLFNSFQNYKQNGLSRLSSKLNNRRTVDMASKILNRYGNPIINNPQDGLPPPPPPPYVPGTSCINNGAPWYEGGNFINGVYPIGTCNDIDFILKANNINSIFIKAATNYVGIGQQNNFPTSVLDVCDPMNSTNTDHFKIYGDIDGNVESTTSMKLHYGSVAGANPPTFEINQGSPGSANSKLMIDIAGNFILNGDVYEYGNHFTFGNHHTFGIASSQGLFVSGSMMNHAIRVVNSSGADRFNIWQTNNSNGDDSKFNLAGSTQIGFYQSTGMVDNSVRLNVAAYGATGGIKVSTDGGIHSALLVYNKNWQNNFDRNFEVMSNGATFIGTGRPSQTGSSVCQNAMLTVDGQILARDIRVSISTGTHWADYVFNKNYKPMPLADIEKYVQKNKHLPEIPSAAEVKKDGVDLLDMNVALLKKVEELYLYTIELKKESDSQKLEIEKLKKR